MRRDASRESTKRDQLLAAVAERPWAHGFFALLRRLNAQYAELPRLGSARRPADEPIRLGQAAELSFAPAELHGVTPGRGGRPSRLDVRFFGLFGPNGPLPLHLTEHARQRRQQGDESFSRFADLFHHRLLLLFWRAWAQAQPSVSLDRPDDPFGDQLGSLIGVGAPSLRGLDAAPDAARLYAAGLVSREARNAEGLETLLALQLGRPVRVECFAGSWMALDARERSRLGGGGAGRGAGRMAIASRLGQGAVLGSQVWDRQHHIGLHVGPLDAEGFAELLPDGRRLPELVALLRFYGSDEWGCQLTLHLDDEAAAPARLGRRPARLGWSAWLGRPRQRQVRLSEHSLARAGRQPSTPPPVCRSNSYG